MAPNTVDLPMQSEPEFEVASPTSLSRPTESATDIRNNTPLVSREGREENYNLTILQSSLSLLAHILIGLVVGTALIFAFNSGLPLTATRQHIVLCVIGYQLLMAEAILSLSSNNGWSSRLKLVDKRRTHWILQILGSSLAIVGSFIKILDKSIHWDTLHGQFALVALVFTSVSLFNGLASLWAHELRKILPTNLSKLTHICFGTVAFVAASITLCYGFEKNLFRTWLGDDTTYAVISFTAILAFIIIINPALTFFKKSKAVISR